MFTIVISNAQTALQINGPDCNGNMHDLYGDLDAGKAVLLHFFMPNCNSCPPPAQEIQAMANNLMISYPGKITGYAMPFENLTTCAYTANWVSVAGLPLYAPYDSGAYQVAYYGGFGMPTVVLLGGTDHRVMFSTLSYISSDTTVMRDSILALFNSPSSINDIGDAVSELNIYPNPTNDAITIAFNLKKTGQVLIELIDLTGKKVAVITDEKINREMVKKQFNTTAIPAGNYIVRLTADTKILTKKITIVH